MEAIVSPAGEIVISAEVTSALDLKAGDHVSLVVREDALVLTPTVPEKAAALSHLPKDATLEEKIAFYGSPSFVDAATEHFRKARAAVAREDAARS